MRGFIPNALTLSNLLCGALALVACLMGMDLSLSAFLILMAAGFDFLDGMVARALGVSGELGKQLDSLADVISFGLVPGAMLFRLWMGPEFILYESLEFHPALFGFLFSAAAAYRLGKFNIDESQSHGFKGLPTPAASLFVLSIPLIQRFEPESFLAPIFETSSFYPVAMVCLSLAMLSNFPLIALKFKSLKFKENLLKYILILGSLVLVLIFHFTAIPIVLLLYLLISIADKLIDS